jgi:hypothetical protein
VAVTIGRSVYTPLANPALIDEYFSTLLSKAAAIQDPYEQAFFAWVQLPYLQPFEDVNKRVSRLAANIPFIKRNLSPLSFVDVPEPTYVEALLSVYELNRTELARDVFIWAYERSARKYAVIRQSLGEPDKFRIQYRDAIRSLVGDIVRAAMSKSAASRAITAYADANVPKADHASFVDVITAELVGLHEGNFARYRVRPSEFFAWKAAWEAASNSPT